MELSLIYATGSNTHYFQSFDTIEQNYLVTSAIQPFFLAILSLLKLTLPNQVNIKPVVNLLTNTIWFKLLKKRLS